MKIKRSIVLPFILGGVLLLLSGVAAYAVYFSNPEGWTHQPVPEGVTDWGPYKYQYAGPCDCYDALGNPTGVTGAMVVMVGTGWMFCTCPDEGGEEVPWDIWLALIQGCPVGSDCAIYTHHDRPPGDPHAHVSTDPGGNPPYPGPAGP
ncbi:MAG: hypothetical protein AB7H80_06565 [Candidatus Kapaibacterium sp.]